MIRMAIAVLLLGLVAGGAGAEPIGDCIPCHREKTPAAVRQWEGSAHARAKIGCEKCHGTDHEKMLRGEARVDMKVCGPCHKKAYDEHKASRHGMGLHSGWGCTRNMPNRNPNECGFCHEEGTLAPKSGVQCARFLKQSSEMGENGCNYCHNVESSCASCHTNHDTDLKIVKDPASCAKCHMGPDHPQWEMWQTSLHGTLNGSKGAELGPDCQRCHMVSGTHNVSIGITKSSAGIPYSGEKFTANREAMLKVCSQCHAPLFARREMTRDDAILKQSLAIVKEAEGIVGELYDRKLLDPMPDNRPPHPLKGSELVLDSQLLYEDTSHIERLLFKMKKYDYARTIKGAYHQNPAYTHWYGNAELKMDLVDIKAEASRLKARQEAPGQKARKTDAESPEERLRVLKSRVERGGMTPGEYAREKAEVLKEMSVKEAGENSKTP